ncbi:MAG: protein translocase subunit SecD [Candidatus Atribacteria bacterium]|nr:protein translocase subunit SecD [Candidatus Atribacteria bacterium]
MNRRQYNWLIFIIPLIALAIWVDVSKQITIPNPFNPQTNLIDRNVETRLGLDLRGGLQVLLEADLPADATISSDDLKVTRQILESRANALGVSEVVMQVAPPRRIVAEFPGLQDPEQVIASLQQTGLLEFVDMGSQPVAEGTIIQTDFGTSTAPTTTTETPTITPTSDPSATPAPTATPAATTTIYHTVMTGAALSSVNVQAATLGGFNIAFTLKSDSATMFADFTGSHINQYLAIVLDKRAISVPSINSKITGGQGIIQGKFTQDSANALAIQLRYGSLPVPVKVVQSRSVGPTLGAESVRRSVIAGIIGLLVVIIFMGLYYRLPGLIADVALVTFALICLMLYKLIPVVLTLSGIAGFILSIGMAVDANILIFERLKEELRAGRTLRQAIDLGWKRAWPSIRDSNFSTLITCVILFWFGSTFGASMVKGFALTLALGVGVSLFTAIIVTRTFLHLVLDTIKSAEHPRWFGI